MTRRVSKWLDLGEWLLHRRWWWITLASLSVFGFEFIEYQPIEHGIAVNFLFEISFYALVLPLSTGLALSWLARSRSELAWSVYYQNLKRNLDLQLHEAHSHVKLADVISQFTKVVIPVVGMSIYKYDRDRKEYKTILNWSPNRSAEPLPSISGCTATDCPCLDNGKGDLEMALQSCRDRHVASRIGEESCYCIPFIFSGNRVASARLFLSPGSTPSPEQIRVIREVTPEISSTFHRIQLEGMMRRQGDKINAEQERIARDVHDSLGHSLAYLRLRLDQINMEFDQTKSTTLQKEVESLRDVAKEAYDQMREVLMILSPNGNAKLSNRLTNYADKISQRANFRFEIRQHGTPRDLPPIIQRNIFYIFQEILTNIERHAHAHLIKVTLRWEAPGLILDVQDDGLGFDTTIPIQNGHFGLKNMKERALESNAQLTITSELGGGTRIDLQVPYQVEK